MAELFLKARSASPSILKHLLRNGFGFVLAGLCLWVMSARIEPDAWRTGPQALQHISPANWLMAGLLTAVSFWAIGRYDAVAHRHLRTGVSDRDARRAGIVAIALSQTLGMGLLTGTLARWRMLNGSAMKDAARVCAFAAVTFIVAWAIVTGLSAALPGGPLGLLPAGVAFVALIGLLALLFFNSALTLFGRSIALPTVPAACAILGWVTVDTITAGAAFWLLMPDTLQVSFWHLFPVFLIALGGALLSGAPGGVGPFELTFFTAFASLPQADILCALIAFRLMYFALPACLALLWLWRPQEVTCEAAPPARDLSTELTDAKRSEVQVSRQGIALPIYDMSGSAIARPLRHSLVALFGALHGPFPAQRLRKAAKERNKIAFAYKLPARDAIALRQTGWRVVHCANEAVLNPITFTTNGADRRQLRRKLRKADAAGVRLALDNTGTDLAEVAQVWATAHGGERGVTMGRFDPDYIARQVAITARLDGRAVGFMSFHHTRHEWCLDLIRLRPDAPEGTGHAILRHAIEFAAQSHVCRMSLVAAPAPWLSDLPILGRHIPGQGLIQFKSCFADHWEPRYCAAPTRAALWLGAADLAVAVRARKYTGAS